MKFNWAEFLNFSDMVMPLWETIYMVVISMFFALLIGLPIGILLVISEENHIAPNKTLNKILDIILINITRSIPFIILMVVLIPLAREIVGKSFGSEAFIVYLSLGSAPFVARVIEGSLNEVDGGLIEASKSLGASNFHIIMKVLLPEALPSLIHGIVLTLITLIGYSAMAGIVGGGGLGNSAVVAGFQNSNPEIIWKATIIIIVLVQIIQFFGNIMVSKIYKKREK